MAGRRVQLLIPPTGLFLRDRCEAVALKNMLVQDIRPPMDLAYMAALLEEAGHECRITDYAAAESDWEAVARDLAEFRPQAVVVSTTSSTLAEDLRACRLARELEPEALTVAKGGFLYAHDRTVLERFEHLDVVLRNEADYAIADIIDGAGLDAVRGITYRAGGEIKRNPDRSSRAELESLPVPARHLLDNGLYRRPDTGAPLTVVLAGKGCPAECIFCSGKPYTGSIVRQRSAAAVVDEIAACVGDLGIRDFLVQTDNISHDKTWVLELCHGIVERGLDIAWGCTSRVDTLDPEILEGLKESGCWVISLGIESGSPEILAKAKKGVTVEQIRHGVALCREAGIRTFLYFVLGLPWESRETIRQTIDLAKELDGDFYEFHLAYPFPKTELNRLAFDLELTTEELVEAGDYATPALSTLHLSREELVYYRKKAMLEVYFRPAYLRRLFRNIHSLGELVNYARFGVRGVLSMLRA